MDCLHSMAPNDEELLSLALDGKPLHPGAKEHFEQCPVCQQRLANYKRFDEVLIARLYRSQCPSATQLNFYCANLLAVEEVMAITDHLEICPLCVSEVKDIRKILADFDPFPSAAPLFLPHIALRRIIATLVPWHPQLVTRGGPTSETGWPRQYRAETLNISLHLSRTSSGEIMLLGLLTSTNPAESAEDFEGTPVGLYRVINPSPESNGHHQYEELVEDPLMSSQVDDLGNIVFKSIPPGEYIMVVRLPETELLIRGLTIDYS
ncbi:MAG TPA: hypothetical protein VKR06_31405 [Ktedonosporobacter sp.]|nr:hypothetical protein [Ktedonosporobacter sp.]